MFNAVVIGLSLVAVGLWIAINYKYSHQIKKTTIKRLNWSLFFVRIWIGLMLILCAMGLLPKENVHYFSIPTLFASDLLIFPQWVFISWLELVIGAFYYLAFLLGMLQ